MAEAMFPDIHDSQVIAYSADSRTREVRLQFRAGPEGSPRFDIRFTGAIAHRFPHPLVPSVVFDLVLVSADELLQREWSVIAESFRLVGWPGSWGESLERAQSHCRSEGTTGYHLQASYGLHGWVLARSVERIDCL